MQAAHMIVFFMASPSYWDCYNWQDSTLAETNQPRSSDRIQWSFNEEQIPDELETGTDLPVHNARTTYHNVSPL